jgi:phenylalanyl-tRNA synthetase beta chain
MKLSLNWIKQFTKVNLPVDELVTKIGGQLGEVDSVENLAPKYEGAVIVKVVACEDHPNADRLHVCRVDDGGVTKDVERGDDGLVQVVCGATNVHAGMLAVWLPPGVTVPESFGREPFVLEARDLRGVVSNGMLASPKELSLGDNHEGILEIDPNEWSPNQKDIKPGANFAKVFGLDDTVIDIENKMFTHRPDLFGQLGLAREVAGITNEQFTSPDWYTSPKELPKGSGLDLEIVNEVPELVPRFTAIALKNVTIKPSPVWLQCELVRVGIRPINNVVDATNYIMVLTAQPTHAYDYDKLRGGKLVARLAKPDEKVALLSHKTLALDPSDIVIADGQGAVGLGGIMGGGDSEVTDGTKNIVLECANFDMYTVRRSSMRHGVFTDALTRFNKGQSPLQNQAVITLLAQSIIDVAGGEVASELKDENTVEGRQWVHPPVTVALDFINSRLGLELDMPYVRSLLEHVEFTFQQDGDKCTLTAPFWRTDIETREDVVEEVGRLHGYDKLPLEMPMRTVAPVTKNRLFELRGRIRENLVKTGANEVLTYSFVHGNLLQKAGQDPSKAFRVSNALSPDLQYFRLSLTPSLLDKVHPNLKAGHDRFALFELGKAHNLDHADDDEGLPTEFEMLDVVYASQDKAAASGAAYFQAEALLCQLVAALGVEIELRPIDKEEDYQVAKPYDHRRSAQIFAAGTDIPLGIIGEYKSSVRRNFKLPVHTAGFGLGLSQLQQAMEAAGNPYRPLSKFPKVTQDLTLRVAADTKYAELTRTLLETLQDVKSAHAEVSLIPLSTYQAKDDDGHKQVSYRLTVVDHDKTLTDTAVNSLLEQAATAANTKHQAERI